MRMVQSFNQDWLFAPERLAHDAPDQRFKVVSLPHTNRLFTHHSVDNTAYQFASTYRKLFVLGAGMLDGRRAFIDFDGAMLVTTVWLNGQYIGTHRGGFTPFSFELTGYLTPGENVLTVYVDATESPNVPPYGGLVDYLTFGGLYRDVHLRLVEPCHIVDVFPKPVDVLTAPGLDCQIKLSQPPTDAHLTLTLTDAGGVVVARHQHAVSDEQADLSLRGLGDITLWSLDNPALYRLSVELLQGGVVSDFMEVRFGFRHAEFCPDGNFYLNGQPLNLFGLNRHQTYPFIGAAAPKHLQQLDADILKHELGCNIVRTSHYAQSTYFLDRCDEIGLLVFEELAGWQHIGDESWQKLVMDDLRAMIERDRHRPSVILWGVRVNESPDDEGFYGETNQLARTLDPTRQTGGVRNFIQSQFLEDVFTLNDFPEGIQQPLVRPHLITEFGGHLFPTKTWDHEERRVEHALHHARKHSLQRAHPDVAGAIGWCAFDYHTHKEFGSGDRICYHGVMDIYRLPKMAAYFYRSQKPPTEEVVLHAATNWTMGDRSGGGNNPLTIFSNCEAVEVFIGDEFQGRFLPDAEQYPALAHPPFTVRWPEPYNPWGTPFRDLTVRGYIGGSVAAEQRIDASHTPDRLRVSLSTDRLKPDGADLARLAVAVVDCYGNVLPYHMHPVRFSLEGDGCLVGANPLVLLGGQGACYVKSGRRAGVITVRAEVDGLASVLVRLTVGG
ncbi:MAG: glycoside hydrolase family 2 protein [Anaerolineae bacterium]|jgi:beta-galactosidase|nr:glycoside hydrolase family 2 protein [Anaerolineae bacterium]